MPLEVDLSTQKRALEQKRAFLEKRPEELAREKVRLAEAERERDAYVGRNEEYAKVANKFKAIRSRQFEQAAKSVQQAAERVVELQTQFPGESLEEVEQELQRVCAHIEELQIKRDLLPMLAAQSGEASSVSRQAVLDRVKKAIVNHRALLPDQKTALLQEADQVFSENERNRLIEEVRYEISYDNLKNQDPAARQALFKGCCQRLANLNLDPLWVHALYESIERKRFDEQVLPNILKQDRVKRFQEIADLYDRLKANLSFEKLIHLTPEQREQRLRLSLLHFETRHVDFKHELESFYQGVLSQIKMAETGDLKQIQDPVVKAYLQSKIEEVFAWKVARKQLEDFPAQLRSQKTLKNRKAVYLEFVSGLPVVVRQANFGAAIEQIYVQTEKNIQLEKMQNVLQKLLVVCVNPHEEIAISSEFQESAMILEKLHMEYAQLQEKHDLLIQENNLIRGCLKDLNLWNQLSFEAKYRAMSFLAQQCHKNLRIRSFLDVLGLRPILEDGNLCLGSLNYQIGEGTLGLLKHYAQEALTYLETEKSRLNWLSKDIYWELTRFNNK